MTELYSKIAPTGVGVAGTDISIQGQCRELINELKLAGLEEQEHADKMDPETFYFSPYGAWYGKWSIFKWAADGTHDDVFIKIRYRKGIEYVMSGDNTPGLYTEVSVSSSSALGAAYSDPIVLPTKYPDSPGSGSPTNIPAGTTLIYRSENLFVFTYNQGGRWTNKPNPSFLSTCSFILQRDIDGGIGIITGEPTSSYSTGNASAINTIISISDGTQWKKTEWCSLLPHNAYIPPVIPTPNKYPLNLTRYIGLKFNGEPFLFDVYYYSFLMFQNSGEVVHGSDTIRLIGRFGGFGSPMINNVAQISQYSYPSDVGVGFKV